MFKPTAVFLYRVEGFAYIVFARCAFEVEEEYIFSERGACRSRFDTREVDIVFFKFVQKVVETARFLPVDLTYDRCFDV